MLHIPRSPGKEYLLLALSCIGEWELDVDDDIVLLLGDLTACGEEGGGGTKCHVIQETGHRKQEGQFVLYPSH